MGRRYPSWKFLRMGNMRKFALDFSLLRKYPNFRNLWLSGLVSTLGSMFTYVAIPFQIKEMTNSYLAVGISGAVELIPLIVFGLYGGVLADAIDRKKMIWAMEAARLVLVGVLALNSILDKPSLLLIYVVTALFAAVDGLQRPSMNAILPKLVGHSELPSASALMGVRGQFGVIVGPSLGGIIIAIFSVTTGYGVDIFSFIISLIFLSRVGKVPALERIEKPSLAAFFEGLNYARSRQDLLGTYLIDLTAMFFAMPTALIPFWADELGTPWALGLLYAAVTIGALFTILTSGWMKHYHFHGRAIILAAVGWGAAVALSGIVHNLPLVFLFLVLAGASDEVSALYRQTIWNQTIPDYLRGRLAGIEMLSYSVGPLAGQLRAATMASATSLAFSITSGGIICIILVSALAFFLPKLRHYNAETDEHAVRERKIRGAQKIINESEKNEE